MNRLVRQSLERIAQGHCQYINLKTNFKAQTTLTNLFLCNEKFEVLFPPGNENKLSMLQLSL